MLRVVKIDLDSSYSCSDPERWTTVLYDIFFLDPECSSFSDRAFEVESGWSMSKRRYVDPCGPLVNLNVRLQLLVFEISLAIVNLLPMIYT